MQPGDLVAESFSHYPPQAKALAVAHLSLLRRLPLSLLPLILGQIIRYDWRFPAEQHDTTAQLQALEGLSPAAFDALMAPFGAVQPPRELSEIDWVNQPEFFAAKLSAFLWSVHQIDDYHAAAQKYQDALQSAFAGKPPAIPRLTIVVIGQGVAQTTLPLFKKLQPKGTLFTNVQPEGGLEMLFEAVKARAQQHPESYAHWYIDGGAAEPTIGPAQGVTVTSYSRLAPVVARELNLANQFVAQSQGSGSIGPEAVSSYLAGLTPETLKLEHDPLDAALAHFEVDLLTQGAGAQIFSTTFVQWASRECLHRAQPLTLLARFQPRQRAASMNQMMSRNPLTQPVDADGSLVDADMGAFYTWINQDRLSGSDQSRFLAWFEDHNLAMAIGPASARGTTSDSPTDLKQILSWM